MWVNIIRVGKGINVISLGYEKCCSLDRKRKYIFDVVFNKLRGSGRRRSDNFYRLHEKN